MENNQAHRNMSRRVALQIIERTLRKACRVKAVEGMWGAVDAWRNAQNSGPRPVLSSEIILGVLETSHICSRTRSTNMQRTAGRSVIDLSVSVPPPTSSEGPGPPNKKQNKRAAGENFEAWGIEMGHFP